MRIERKPLRSRLVEAVCAASRGSSRARGPAPGLPIQQIVVSSSKAEDERRLVAARAANAAAFYTVRWDRLGVLQVLPLAKIECGESVADLAWDPHSGREAAVVTEGGGIQLISFSKPGEEEGASSEAEGLWSKGLADEGTRPGHDEGEGPEVSGSPAEDVGEAGTSKSLGSPRKEESGEGGSPESPNLDFPPNEGLQYERAKTVGVKQQILRRNTGKSPDSWWRCVYGHNSNSLVVADWKSVMILELARREDLVVESERRLLELSEEPRPGAVAWEPGGLVPQVAEAVCALARSEDADGAGRFLLAVATTYRVLLWDTRRGSAPLLQVRTVSLFLLTF